MTVFAKPQFLGLVASFFLTGVMTGTPTSALAEPTATGDLGLVIERATGTVVLVDQSERAALARIEGLGDLSHASLVYSPDERFAYVFGRDGTLLAKLTAPRLPCVRHMRGD